MLLRKAFAWFGGVAGAAAVICFAATGCSTPVQGSHPEQLGGVDVSGMGLAPGAQSAKGKLSVKGVGFTYTVGVAGAASPMSVSVQSPAESVLDALDGSDATVEITTEGYAGRSIVVSDATGVAYIASSGDSDARAAVDAHLGAGSVHWGDTIGTQGDGTYIWTFTKIVFESDDGPVALAPGEIAYVHIQGATYRAVATRAYELKDDPDADALPGCITDDILGFELLRVASAPAAVGPALHYDETLGNALSGLCGTPPEPENGCHGDNDCG